MSSRKPNAPIKPKRETKSKNKDVEPRTDEAGEVKCDWVTRMRHILRQKKDACAGLLSWWEKLGKARLGDKDVSTASIFVNKILQMMKTNYWRIVEGDELTAVTGFVSIFKLQNYFTTYLSQSTLDPSIVNWMREFEPRAGDNKSLDYCLVELFTGEKALGESKQPTKLSPAPAPSVYSVPRAPILNGNQQGGFYQPYCPPQVCPYPQLPLAEVAKSDKEEDDKGSKKKKKKKDSKKKSHKSKKGSKKKSHKSKKDKSSGSSDSRKHKSKSGRRK